MTESNETIPKVHYICQTYVEKQVGRAKQTSLVSNSNILRLHKRKNEQIGNAVPRLASVLTLIWLPKTQILVRSECRLL